MEVFNLRQHVVDDYADYVRSFIEIRNPDIRAKVDQELRDGFLWPDGRAAFVGHQVERLGVKRLLDGLPEATCRSLDEAAA